MDNFGIDMGNLAPAKAIVDERRNICNSCETSKLGFCTQCGCFLLAKTMLKSQACPLKKWIEVTD